MNSIPCNIVLLPSDELAQKAVAASSVLQPLGSLIALSNTGPFPHLSLYMTQLKEADLERVKDILVEIAAQTAVFSLTADCYFQAEGYLDPNYESVDRLATLQITVVDTINPIRDGMRAKDVAKLEAATGIARQNLQQYGYKNIGELFRPHMTIGRMKAAEAVDTAALPPVADFSGRFVKLGLFEMGDNGTCTRKIAEFALASS